jgi:hypothetical protein
VTRGRGRLHLIDGPQDSLARLHQFQGDHPEVVFTAPHMGGQGRYIAVVPPGSAPGDAREITANSVDLAGLMDQLDDVFSQPAAPD